ncbi:MAG TPA: hypothetical protein PLA68_10035 [Panacibacter sp.]|nr:hypothetical protein [Panacibacter sp.]
MHNKTSPFTQAPVFVLQQLDRKVIQPNGDYTIFGGTRRLAQWADSSGDPGFPHGWFRVTGNITGNEMKGSESYQYTSTIDALNPLVYRNCAYIVQGKLHVEFTNGQSPWDVDYGKARTCDDLAELTIDGVTTTVNLPLEP